MEKMTLILCNFVSPEAARSVARILMQEKTITCANIFQPHFSIYPWEGEIVEENETCVLFKGPLERREDIIKRIYDLHPYDLPGIISLDAEVMPKYAQWLRGEFGHTKPEAE